MPWQTPTLRQTREIVRGEITALLGTKAFVAQSVLRVMADATAALSHLVMRYIDWLTLQLLPDTAETEFLNRHSVIWLVNADGSLGRKAAASAVGTVTFTGTDGIVVPQGTQVSSGTDLIYQTTSMIVLGAGATEAPVRAISSGIATNLETGDTLSVDTTIAGVDSSATVVLLRGGTDVESDDLLRERVLERIRKPPMGGDADDFVAWAKAVAGVTRAWAAPLEMGIGTVSVRFMMDDLRATSDPLTDGFPTTDDVAAVAAYLDTVRPVAVKDFFVEAPLPEAIDFSIDNLFPDTTATRAAIAASVAAMLKEKARPSYARNGVLQEAQTIHREWVSAAILDAENVESFDLIMTDHVMPAPGYIGVFGTITYL